MAALAETVFEAIRDHVFEVDEAEVRAKIEEALRTALTAGVGAKTRGEQLYEACAMAFDLTGAWNAPGRDLRRGNYQRAAQAFIKALLAR